VAQYLTQSHVWTGFFVPGLRRALGPAWWAIIALSAAGALGAVLDRHDRSLRLLGAVTLLSGIAFLVTPQFLGLPGAPIYFVYNVRYAAAPLALGLALIPLQTPVWRAPRLRWWPAVAVGLLVATELDPGVWPTGLGLKAFASPIHGAPALVGAVCAAVLLVLALCSSRWGWFGLAARACSGWSVQGRAVALAGSLSIAVAAGWGVATTYAHGRYRATPPLPAIYGWARGVQHARIGIVGIVQQYPLYGSTDSNYVQYLGAPGPNRGYAPILDCRAWRETIDRGHYGWLVLAPPGFPIASGLPPELRWTVPTRAATVMLRERAEGLGAGGTAVLVRISGVLDPRTCPAA
jgi:hypothetical protein